MDNLTLRVQGGNYMRDHKGLKDIARNIRKDIVSMIHTSKSGHPGGSLSAVEILTALYFDEMNIIIFQKSCITDKSIHAT